MKIKVFCDGASRGNPGPAASAFIVTDKENSVVFQQGKLLGKTTNNVAEYNAVLNALEWIREQAELEFPLDFFLDSLLVVSQLTGKFRIKDKNLLALAVKIKNLEKSLNGKINYHHVARNFNRKADSLVNLTLDNE